MQYSRKSLLFLARNFNEILTETMFCAPFLPLLRRNWKKAYYFELEYAEIHLGANLSRAMIDNDITQQKFTIIRS